VIIPTQRSFPNKVTVTITGEGFGLEHTFGENTETIPDVTLFLFLLLPYGEQPCPSTLVPGI
jgi:hypothetical protein